MAGKTVRLFIDSDLRQVPRVGETVKDLCSSISLPKMEGFDVELCVIEAVNNAILHAYGNKRGYKVEVVIRIQKSRLVIQVSDRGHPMKGDLPRGARRFNFKNPPERGRGLYLIKKIMDEVQYTSGRGKNTLTMSKFLMGGKRENSNMEKQASRKRRTKSVKIESEPGELKNFQESIRYHVKHSCGKRWEEATKRDLFTATSLAVREHCIRGMLDTEIRYRKARAKRLYYLSMEFLMGKILGANLQNLGLYDSCRSACRELDLDLDAILSFERDAALGNGGLGRLAACFLDSLATLKMPGFGYGINYEYGLFRQEIDNGNQKEQPDFWLSNETPWLIRRPDEAVIVPLYGRVEHARDMSGGYNPMWMDWKMLIGVPHDLPIVGYGGQSVNFLRLFSAKASDEFDMRIFNEGDYFKAVEEKISSETVSKVLYPSDAIHAGKELRLIQEYFLVACSVRDIIRRYLRDHKDFDSFPDRVAIQLNDTHPALTVAELMRTLVDENDIPWDKAWDITVATTGYTNHTLMPEALERWPVPLMGTVLPRHLQIIYEINHRFLKQVSQRWPDDQDRARRMSLISTEDPEQVLMANLSIVGSHSVNGVAALHSRLVKTALVPDFFEMWPEKFNNKTNGVTPRKWLLGANPDLAKLITANIGDSWITDLRRLRELESFASEKGFQDEFQRIKSSNKERLAKVISDSARVGVDPRSVFDIQAKRIHEYKRQLLNALHIIHQYLSIVEDRKDLPAGKTYVFSGKAAPGYEMAKLIIKLINNIGATVNRDSRVGDQLKVVFVPDYRVSVAEVIIPAAEISEQISTAGMEASGTGNMKFAMNGALTVGTLDGANVEIKEEVGEENIYIFGHTVEEIQWMRYSHSYDPRKAYEGNPAIHRVLDALGSDLFSPKEPGIFRPIYDHLLNRGDYYFNLADFQPYLEAQERALQDYMDQPAWWKKAILNVARCGKFSSDYTISEYAREIWNLKPVE